MSPIVAVLVLLNNYVHDVATGLLIVSALWLGWTAGALGDSPGPEALGLFRRVYGRSLALVGVSVGIIVATGVVRAWFFMRMEWFPALGKGLVPILVTKHVLIFTLLGVGVWAHARLRRRLRGLVQASPTYGTVPGTR